LATELVAELPDRPGVLADAAGAVGRVNVNIRAFSAVASGKLGELRLLVDDPDAAERALEAAGFAVRRHEVIAVRASNTPGELAAHAERLSRAGVHIRGGYLAAKPDGGFDMIFEVSEAAPAAGREGPHEAPTVRAQG
jgi:hypothetical protein